MLSKLALALTACAALTLPSPASAGPHKQKCEAWNNCCRPACGSGNANCAGQSTQTIIGRMSLQSFFANPWYHGQRLEPDDWWDRGPGLRKSAPQGERPPAQ